MKENVKYMSTHVNEVEDNPGTEVERSETSVPGENILKIKRVSTEVSERAKRRIHPISYKIKILEEIENSEEVGAINAILRREGLFSSTISGWRKQREQGKFNKAGIVKRGRKPKPIDPRDKKIKELERENKKLKKDLGRSKVVIEIQKKIAELLNIDLNEKEEDK